MRDNIEYKLSLFRKLNKPIIFIDKLSYIFKFKDKIYILIYSTLNNAYVICINHHVYSISNELLFEIGRFIEYNILKIMVKDMCLIIETYTYEKFQHSI